MTAPTTAARLAALEARVTQLETINSRLIDVASRLMSMLDERTLFAVEELAERDSEAAATTAELAAAIRSRAPRGFKIPITIHETIVENRDRVFWVNHNYRTFKTLNRALHLEDLLVQKGIITPMEHHGLAIEAGLDREPPVED